ncbi:MAG: type II secretion system F family protein [Proteobacteria bacterium]|nr:type II secretion system F family protein [Pseudomonadota bacterium]
MNIDSQFVFTFLAALAAGLSFIAVVLPIMNKRQKRERYQETIARQRKDIYEAQKKEREKRINLDKSADAKTTIAASFKVRKIVGDLADDLRSKMLQAGKRSPNAPLVFMILRIALPIGFIITSMVLMGSMEKDLDDSVKLLIIFALGWFGFALPGIMLKNDIIKRQTEINLSFPDALDMMLVCVQGGISLEQAVNRIAEEMADHSHTLSEELGQLGAELGLLNDRRTAFQEFAKRVGSGGAKSFATAMIQAEQYGTGISTALRVMADELRDARMAEAERKAAALPPKLTVPMIVFFLPALFIVILGPAGIQASIASAGG